MSDIQGEGQGQGNPPIADEVLMAYADGTLPAAERAAVSEALAHSTSLMHRFESFLFTRGPLARAFDETLAAPIPEKLLAIVREATPARRTPSLLESLGLAELAARLRMAALSPAGAAAVLLIGATGGWLLQDAVHGDLVRLDDRGLIASASLRQGLEATPSGGTADVTRTFAIRPKFTFQSVGKDWCRQYDLINRRGQQATGLACREQGAWRVLVQKGAAPATDTPDKTVPADKAEDIVDGVRGQIKDGDVLGREQEERLIKERWQAKP